MRFTMLKDKDCRNDKNMFPTEYVQITAKQTALKSGIKGFQLKIERIYCFHNFTTVIENNV